jgi:flavodoxin I
MSRFVIVYLTLSGNTKKIAEAIAEGAMSQDMSTNVVNFQDTTPEMLQEAEAIGIGSPTYMHTMHGQMKKFMNELRTMPGKKGVAFGSYGWSGEAPWHIAHQMRKLGINVLDPVVRVQYEPNEKDIEACKLLGKDVAIRLKNIRRQESILPG